MSQIKLTNQRLKILEFIKENYTHPSVDEVYEYCKNDLPRISKKTVYNNLKVLCENNLIQEIKVKGIFRYEPIAREHPHIICRKCGKIRDFKNQELQDFAENISEKIPDFDVDLTSITFYGICKDCK